MQSLSDIGASDKLDVQAYNEGLGWKAKRGSRAEPPWSWNTVSHGRPQDFFLQGGQPGGLGSEVPQRGPGAEPRWGSGGEAPRSWRQC